MQVCTTCIDLHQSLTQETCGSFFIQVSWSRVKRINSVSAEARCFTALQYADSHPISQSKVQKFKTWTLEGARGCGTQNCVGGPQSIWPYLIRKPSYRTENRAMSLQISIRIKFYNGIYSAVSLPQYTSVTVQMLELRTVCWFSRQSREITAIAENHGTRPKSR